LSLGAVTQQQNCIFERESSALVVVILLILVAVVLLIVMIVGALIFLKKKHGLISQVSAAGTELATGNSGRGQVQPTEGGTILLQTDCDNSMKQNANTPDLEELSEHLD
jgi:flagellar basal body-associated protein FliL